MSIHVENIYLSRQTYGVDKGKVTGHIDISTGRDSRVKLHLNEKQVAKIIAVIADAVVTSAREAANLVLEDMEEHMNLTNQQTIAGSLTVEEEV